MAEPRRLLVVLGDQLDANAPLMHNADPARDAIWMCECAFEADKVWSHKARITLFFAAMRHFAEALRARGWTVHYRHIGEHAHNRLGEALAEDLRALKPATVAMTEAGEWDVAKEIRATVNAAGLSLETLEDEHFLCSRAAFAASRSPMSPCTPAKSVCCVEAPVSVQHKRYIRKNRRLETDDETTRKK